jgi:hypothetical protein
VLTSSPGGFAKSWAVITKSIYPFPRRSPECALGILCRRTQHVKLMHLLWVPLYSAEHYELIE